MRIELRMGRKICPDTCHNKVFDLLGQTAQFSPCDPFKVALEFICDAKGYGSRFLFHGPIIVCAIVGINKTNVSKCKKSVDKKKAMCKVRHVQHNANN